MFLPTRSPVKRTQDGPARRPTRRTTRPPQWHTLNESRQKGRRRPREEKKSRSRCGARRRKKHGGARAALDFGLPFLSFLDRQKVGIGALGSSANFNVYETKNRYGVCGFSCHRTIRLDLGLCQGGKPRIGTKYDQPEATASTCAFFSSTRDSPLFFFPSHPLFRPTYRLPAAVRFDFLETKKKFNRTSSPTFFRLFPFFSFSPFFPAVGPFFPNSLARRLCAIDTTRLDIVFVFVFVFFLSF